MPYFIKRKPKKKKNDNLPLFDAVGIKVKKKPDLVAKLDKVFSTLHIMRTDKAVR